MMNYDWSTLPENVHDVNGHADSDGQRACPSARGQVLMNCSCSTSLENVHDDKHAHAESDGQRACPSARGQGLMSGALEENPDSTRGARAGRSSSRSSCKTWDLQQAKQRTIGVPTYKRGPHPHPESGLSLPINEKEKGVGEGGTKQSFRVPFVLQTGISSGVRLVCLLVAGSGDHNASSSGKGVGG